MSLEVASAEMSFDHETHDRVVMISDIGRFAVFDGAGQAFMSDIATRVFTDKNSVSPLPLRQVFAEIQKELIGYQDSLPEELEHVRGMLLTTGTAVDIKPDSDEFVYAHAGDSSLYMFDFDSSELMSLTRQEHLDNFLGSYKFYLCQNDRLTLPDHAVFTLFSDGVGDKTKPKGSVTESQIGEILSAGLPVQEKADQLIETSSIRDDRSVIVIEYEK